MSAFEKSRLSANISIMFTEWPYLERPAAARAAGFQHVETWWPFAEAEPAKEDVDQFLKVIHDSGVSLTGLNFYAGDMPGGERGIACRPDRREQLNTSTDTLLCIAESTGCRHFNLLYGQIDDRWTIEEQESAAVEAILKAAARVNGIGGTVLLEPLAEGLNGRYPLKSCDQVVNLLEGPLAEAENIRLLFDTFHLGSNTIDIVQAARRHADWIGHVQVADAPGRGEPGSGALPIGAAMKELQGAYHGIIALEYKPTESTKESIVWIADAEWLK